MNIVLEINMRDNIFPSRQHRQHWSVMAVAIQLQ